MSARRRARRRALEILFEAEQRGIDPLTLLQERSGDPEYPMRPYSREIVSGTAALQEEIDEVITSYSLGWELDRMPAVDRALLRIGVWELLHNDDIPDKVAISEATELAREFSTDDSPKFVSGLLSRVLEVKPALGG
ncbi:transcription antitermination factor NusB [Sediminivirga luteola]|uniref:Transcription antitermination protein NusB n=1 Tax=Sediminivirga luteola TaxID=1774748 RepID=A0A8J2TYX3_9MICO|nr:transcription antitermination factor NusB [Sediminivirga luteola]MCI2264161.1 transcription antitermination factor NusB [Sediminivirga luteola]GGA17699.1 hypothetical protein GCM10011333_21020 [Sediminivirga luteola]